MIIPQGDKWKSFHLFEGSVRKRVMVQFRFKSNEEDVSELEIDLAETIVSGLRLDMAPLEIDVEAPLFGEGLGLDSIDALEIAVCVSERYGIQLRSDDPDNKRIFASLRSLAMHITARLPLTALGVAATRS